MADLQQSVDPTGDMSQTDLHGQDIKNIIAEFNRLTTQLGSNNQLTLYSDGTSNRYEIGYQTDGWGAGKNVGIKASKPGVEVTTATDNNLAYKDDFSTKTWYSGSGPVLLEGLLPDGGYGYRVLDTNGKPVAQFGLQADGSTNLKYFDTNNNVVSQFGRQSDGSTNLKFFDINGIGVAQFGRFADNSTALKVAKSGVEVSTATDNQLIFNSSQDIFKIVVTGTATVTVGPGDNFITKTTTIAHGLGYTPIVMGFVDAASSILTAGGRVITPYAMYEEQSATGGFIDNSIYILIGLFTVTADATNIYCSVGTHKADFYTQLQGDWQFKYYILQETAS